MSRLACALLALVAATGVAAWPFEVKTGLPLCVDSSTVPQTDNCGSGCM